MSYAPARARSRAPWIALLLALASVFTATPASAEAGPSLSAEVTAASQASGLSVRVVGSGIAPEGGYLAIIEKGTEAGVTGRSGYVGFAYWAGIQNGGIESIIDISADKLDRAKLYEVILWQHQTNPNADTIIARTDVAVTSGQWDAVFPPAPEPEPVPAPDYGITVDQSTLATEGYVTVNGTFPATYTATNGSTQTMGLYLMNCVEPAGAPGTGSTGRPTGPACLSSAQKWVIQPGVAGVPGSTNAGTVTDGVWTFSLQFTPVAAWSTTECVAATPASDGGVTCGIFVRPDHNSGSGVNATYTYDQFVPLAFPAPAASPAITTAVTSASAASGLTVRVQGASFGDVTGAYAALIEKGTEANVGRDGGYAAFGYWATPGVFVNGAFDQSLTAAADKLDRTKQYEVIVWQKETMPGADTIYARADVTVSPAQWDAVVGSSTPPQQPEDPGTVTPVTTGSLSWGVKGAWRAYVTGPIASGSIITTGASTFGNAFVFPQTSDAALANGVGTVSYGGTVRFTGHHGELDLRFSNPQVRIDSATSGTLLVTVNGSTVAFANLALGSASRTVGTDGSVRYGNVPATLTAAGAVAFRGFYGAGEALDPVSFTIGAKGAVTGGTVTVASAAVRNPIPATPPATEGLDVSGDVQPGGSVSATASGFQPNESGIRVVIYSTPTVLAQNVTADANGVATWTGKLPQGLTGTHTLTFQGSVARGAVLELDAVRALAALQCTVDDATLVWGFKESFRAYIDGSIANGEWTTVGDDVSYATPDFTWVGGTGSTDGEEALDLAFAGGIRFTGHGGILDTTVENPRIVIDDDSALLIVDIHGTTQTGEAVDQADVEFGELDLTDATVARDGDTLTWTAVPATLTESGSAAFGTYPAGEALDPLTIVATVDAECGEPLETPEATPSESDVEADPASDAGWPVWATVLIALLAAAIIVALVVILVRRRTA